MIINISSQIHIHVKKSGWFKPSYQFTADGATIGRLEYTNSYQKKATASIDGRDFSIRRGGFWKHYIEITSDMHKEYNMRIDVDWRSRMKITDHAGNPFVFKSASIWKNKWHWIDRHGTPVIEIQSKYFSKNRGAIEIKHADVHDTLFWIIVSWFVILCSEADAAPVAATA